MTSAYKPLKITFMYFVCMCICMGMCVVTTLVEWSKDKSCGGIFLFASWFL